MVMLVEPVPERGGHLVDAGDAGELTLERRGDGGGHGLGVGAGERCADGDDGVFDLWK